MKGTRGDLFSGFHCGVEEVIVVEFFLTNSVVESRPEPARNFTIPC